MALSGIGTSYSLSQEQIQNMANLYHKNLNISKCIDLNDPSNVTTIQDALSGISDIFDTQDPEIMKDLAENIDHMKIKPYDKNNRSELKLKNCDGSYVNTTNFESILNTMSLTDEQRSSLNKAMQSASDVLNKNQTNGDTYGMRISQANMEFKYISAKILPEKYQDTFNSYIDKYTKELSDSYVNLEKNMTESMMNNMDQTLVSAGWQSRGKDLLASLENGTDVFQASGKEYQKLYNSIDVTNPNKTKEQLDSVYKNILSKGTSSWWGADSQSLTNEVKYLSEKWNSLMDTMGEKSNMKFTTSVNYTA